MDDTSVDTSPSVCLLACQKLSQFLQKYQLCRREIVCPGQSQNQKSLPGSLHKSERAIAPFVWTRIKIFIENNLKSFSSWEFLHDISKWKLMENGKRNIYYIKSGKSDARKCTYFIIHALNSSFLLKRDIKRHRLQIWQAKCNYIFLATTVMMLW